MTKGNDNKYSSKGTLLMRKKGIPAPSFPTLAVAIAIALVYIASFLALSADATSPWVEVHPSVIPELAFGLISIHFIDADTGWAEGPGYEVRADGRSGGREQNVLLRTSDGGQSWHKVEPHEEVRDFPINFYSPRMGQRILNSRRPSPNLLDDIEYYHSADGGLTWQLRRGKVTELVRIGNEVPEGPLRENRRIFAYQAYFVDDRHGWLTAITDDWRRRWNEADFPVGKPLAANVLCSTRDGGQSWKCQVHVYLSQHEGHRSIALALRAPENIDFVDPRVGWIVPRSGWIYHTVDGGATWELVPNPIPDRVLIDDPFITDIDFVDESRGWVVTYGSGVWYTDDAGKTWEQKLSGRYWAVYADSDSVWVAGRGTSPTNYRETREGIFYSSDDGETWQWEWEGSNWLTYIGYHEVTQSLWAGGADGFILRRTSPATAVTPKGKLPALWGQLKAPPAVSR